MKATASLRDTENKLSIATQERIWAFLEVLELQSPQAGERGLQKLGKICDQAVELSMMMRKAKDDIYIYFGVNPNERPLSAWEDLIEEGSSAATDSPQHKHGHISYIYAGALVKVTKYNPEERLVLETAEAVVYSG